MALIRTFIAVEFSTGLKDEIGKVQQKLKKDLSDLKWVSANNYHLTLKFLGDVESRQIGALAAGLTRAVQGFAPFTLNLAGVGGFPRSTEPRVLWIGVEDGKEELIRLQKIIDDELKAQGFPPETKRYSPHLTLARAREGSDLKSIGTRLSLTQVAHVGSEQVSAIQIMKSDLRPGGPVYTCLQEIPLEQSNF